jgi:hypothetical protein
MNGGAAADLYELLRDDRSSNAPEAAAQ